MSPYDAITRKPLQIKGVAVTIITYYHLERGSVMTNSNDAKHTLTPGMKRSITLSIRNAFKSYMAGINWDEDRYSSDDFLTMWLKQARQSASWYKELDQSLDEDEDLQGILLDKVNQTIRTIFETPPTNEQMDQIEAIISANGLEDIPYSCKMEADYVLATLTSRYSS